MVNSSISLAEDTAKHRYMRLTIVANETLTLRLAVVQHAFVQQNLSERCELSNNLQIGGVEAPEYAIFTGHDS